MLIIKSITAGDVGSFKLVNGDEVVARVDAINGDEYVLEKP